ncbi:MAG: hypothetical protein ACR2LF_05200 [Jatrophihabitantaceae bacterium]
MADPDQRLFELLGDAPPASVSALPEAVRAELADVIIEARRSQARSLAAAFDAALKHVPFPARGIVKRVLLG